jgi:hypothetical protein
VVILPYQLPSLRKEKSMNEDLNREMERYRRPSDLPGLRLLVNLGSD